jgi:hypothetical protein
MPLIAKVGLNSVAWGLQLTTAQTGDGHAES